MYTLDTNPIIYYINGESRVVNKLRHILSQKSPVYTSTITEIELLGFPGISNAEVLKIEAILQTLSIVPIDSEIARIAGTLRRQYRLKTPDAAVAATCLFTGSTLVTRNVRDFERIPNFTVEKI